MAIVYQYTSPYYWSSSAQYPFSNKLSTSPSFPSSENGSNSAAEQYAALQYQHQQYVQQHLQQPQHHNNNNNNSNNNNNQYQLTHSLSSSSLSSYYDGSSNSPPTIGMKRHYSSDEHSDEHLVDGCEFIDDEGSDIDDEYLQEEQLKTFLLPFIKQILESKSSQPILNLISECLKEYITVKAMLSKVKIICKENQLDYIYQTLVQTFIKVDGDVKMVNYLTDCGVDNDDLEFVKDIELTQNNVEIVKKKRERKRESISRGLRSPPNKWTKEESQNLIRLVSENGDKQWKKIASKLGGGKTGAQCAQHWKRVLSPEIKKGSWDEDEEYLLFQLVEKHGQSWKNVAMEIKTRTDIQCRYQYFKATTSRQTPWSTTELELLIKKIDQILAHNYEVTSFQQVAKHLARAKTTKIPRTALECKVKWNEICSYYNTQLNRHIPQQQIILMYRTDHFNPIGQLLNGTSSNNSSPNSSVVPSIILQ